MIAALRRQLRTPRWFEALNPNVQGMLLMIVAAVSYTHLTLPTILRV